MAETRASLPATTDQSQRIDYEYKLEGHGKSVKSFELLARKKQAKVAVLYTAIFSLICIYRSNLFLLSLWVILSHFNKKADINL